MLYRRASGKCVCVHCHHLQEEASTVKASVLCTLSVCQCIATNLLLCTHQQCTQHASVFTVRRCFPELTAAFENLLHMQENLDSATISTLQIASKF